MGPLSKLLTVRSVLLFIAVTASVPSTAATGSSLPLEVKLPIQKTERVSRPGVVELAPYGEPEDVGLFYDRAILAIRFDPPFDAPYRIDTIRFPSLTESGASAHFAAVSLCEFDQTTGLIKLATPLARIAPYEGSGNGVNDIPVIIDVSNTSATLYLCVEFPPTPTTSPDTTPFLRYDAVDTEHGEFGSSYLVNVFGAPTQVIYGNYVASLVCSVSPDQLPPAAPVGFGSNRIGTGIEFHFVIPGKKTPKALTNILFRHAVGPWTVVRTIDSRAESIEIGRAEWDSLGEGYWAAQTIDKEGRRSVQSNVAWVPFAFSRLWEDDQLSPNGRPDEATPLVLSPSGTGYWATTPGSLFSAGDRDYWSFEASPGATITARIRRPPITGLNDMQPVLVLYDGQGRVIAMDASEAGLRYHVPDNSKDLGFKLLVSDAPGTSFAPDKSPRHLRLSLYDLDVNIESAAPALTGAAYLKSVRVGDGVRLSYRLPESVEEHARVQVFDVHGRLVATLIPGGGKSGASHAVTWNLRALDGPRVSRGSYFARLTAGKFISTCKINVGGGE